MESSRITPDKTQSPIRKSRDFYCQNEKEIAELRELYNQLYAVQPFSAGFTDRSFKYYVAEIKTDSVRYIYNTEKNKKQVANLIEKFKYDTTLVNRFSKLLKEVRCLWISRTILYEDMVPQSVVILSFKSALFEKNFQENKYYVLLFPERKLSGSVIKRKMANGEIIMIDQGVYFSIMSKFR